MRLKRLDVSGTPLAGIALEPMLDLLPTLRTLYLSLFNANSTQLVGLSNYLAVFSERTMLNAFQITRPVMASCSASRASSSRTPRSPKGRPTAQPA